MLIRLNIHISLRISLGLNINEGSFKTSKCYSKNERHHESFRGFAHMWPWLRERWRFLMISVSVLCEHSVRLWPTWAGFRTAWNHTTHAVCRFLTVCTFSMSKQYPTKHSSEYCFTHCNAYLSNAYLSIFVVRLVQNIMGQRHEGVHDKGKI